MGDFPLWIQEARQFADVGGQHNMRAAFTLAWKDARGDAHSAVIPQAELFDARAWTTWLANNNLASYVEATNMARYISKMHKIRFREHGARTIYDRLGWYEDHSLFVTGKQGVRATGTEDVIVEASGNIADLMPKGSLAAWKAGITVLGQPRYRAQAFGLLIGFAAPCSIWWARAGRWSPWWANRARARRWEPSAGCPCSGTPSAYRARGATPSTGWGPIWGSYGTCPPWSTKSRP